MKKYIFFKLILLSIFFNSTESFGQFAASYPGTINNSPTALTVNGLYIGARNLSYGSGNSAVGVNALGINFSSAPTGSWNTAFGYFTLNQLTTGSNNTGIGTYALDQATTGSGNTGAGYRSLECTTGSNNVAIGSGSAGGVFNSGGGSIIWNNGSHNTALGNATLQRMAGSYNVAVGEVSMQSSLNGDMNTALGYYSLYGLQNGNDNLALGHNALGNFQSGNNNVAIGTSSQITGNGLNGSNQLSIQNVIFGVNMDDYRNASLSIGIYQGPSAIGGGLASGAFPKLRLGTNQAGTMPSLQLSYVPNYTGSGAVTNQNGLTGRYLFVDQAGVVCQAPAVGLQGLQGPAGPPGPVNNNAWLINGNTSLSDANFIGSGSGQPTTIPFNIKIGGDRAGRIDPNLRNTFYGSLSGNSVLPGLVTDNTAIGYNALTSNIDGLENTAVGSGALQANWYGAYNNAFGFNALGSNTTGHANVGIGGSALQHNQTAWQNTAVGNYALFGQAGQDMGDANTAVGFAALGNNTGGFNTALGESALGGNSSGGGNVAIGSHAMDHNLTGNGNIGIGTTALGDNQTGSFNIALGNQADVWSGNLQNAIAIGYNARVATSNTMQLGANNFTDDIQQVIIGNAITLNASATSNLITGKLEVRNSPVLDYVLTCTDASTGKAEWKPVPCTCIPREPDSLMKEEIKELQEQNIQLRKEIDELKSMITSASETGSVKITQTTDSKLFQNAPNPFTRSTVIKYSIPTTAKKAILSITSISGVKIKEFDLKNKNAQSIEISAGELSAGTYIYSLIVDDSLVDAKQMVLTR